MLALTVNLTVLSMLLIRIVSHWFKINSLAFRAGLDTRTAWKLKFRGRFWTFYI